MQSSWKGWGQRLLGEAIVHRTEVLLRPRGVGRITALVVAPAWCVFEVLAWRMAGATRGDFEAWSDAGCAAPESALPMKVGESKGLAVRSRFAASVSDGRLRRYEASNGSRYRSTTISGFKRMEPLLHKAAIARRQYVAHFVASLEEWRLSEAAAIELLVKPNGRVNPEPFSLCRVDVITGLPEAPELHRFAAGLDAAAWGIEAAFGDMQMAVASFSWESLVVTFSLREFDVSMLRDWYARWLDIAEEHAPDENGLSGVVHDLSWESDQAGGWRLIADLGSAPIRALEELLHRLHDLGVERCSITRGDLDDA